MKATFQCIDAHTCGNPVRLVVTGGPELEGKSIAEKRQHFLKEYDWIRRGLMFEPRGHDMMSGSFLYPPADPSNDAAVLFIETSGCLPMCGHGTIGTVTIAIQEKIIQPKHHGQLRLEVPAGLIQIQYVEDNDKVKSVRLTNVPSFLHSSELKISIPSLGDLTADVAYGGNFYAIIDPQKNFSGLQDYPADQLIAWGRMIRNALNEKYSFVHPSDDRINGCSHVLWTGQTIAPTSSGRSAVLYGEKAIDRSPCGTGTSARMAQLFSKGLLSPGQPFVHESIIGSTFEGKIVEIVDVGPYKGIIPTIEGWAKVTGYNTITIDTDDPFAFGFQVL